MRNRKFAGLRGPVVHLNVDLRGEVDSLLRDGSRSIVCVNGNRPTIGASSGGYRWILAHPSSIKDGVNVVNVSPQVALALVRQLMDATYMVNVALIKAHSYPYAGAEGQTGVTMTSKNQFGSIKGTPELHDAINTNQHGTPHAYSPIVDVAASPNLGAKTILYVLDGLYCARRHQSYPLHFPNAPFNNRVEPYATPSGPPVFWLRSTAWRWI